MSRGLRILAIALVACLARLRLGGQSVNGNVYGRVIDEQGAPLPAVTVSLKGLGAPVSTTTTENGEFRFLNLSPGEYRITAARSGLSTVEHPRVVVASRQNAEVLVTLTIATQTESVIVTGEPPILDTRKSNVGVNVTERELEAIPTARDPWVIVQTTPGVLVDRVNVGGSESGQQSYFIGKGAGPGQSQWILEGMVFQQMAGLALGASPLYYDFDSFAEVQVSTGGTDPAVQTPGVQVNLVTKRGTNTVHGSARFYMADEAFEATNIPEELKLQLEAGGSPVSGNSIRLTQDYGAEVGGALVTDRLWLWAAYGRNQIDLITTGGQPDDTTLEAINAKLNATPFQGNAATAYYYRDDKVKFGRDAGLQRPPETTWDQSGPANAYMFEDSQVFTENLFATVTGSYKAFGFDLVPQGRGQMRQDTDQVFHNTYYTALYHRPDWQVGAKGTYFFRTGALGHEVRLGGLYRMNEALDRQVFEGNVVACDRNANFCGNQPVPTAQLNRDFVVHVDLHQYSAYIADTITLPRLTVNLGLRYDNQNGVNAPVVVEGSRATDLVPPGTVLPPTLNLPQSDPGYRWEDWEPRIGVTYAAGQDQKTLLRASFSRYANQLGTASIAPFSAAPPTLAAAGAGVVYPWNDVNQNQHVDPGEIDTTNPPLTFFGFDPSDPNNVTSSINAVDPNFRSGKTNEITASVERELTPSMAVSLGGTYRRMTDFELSSGFGLTEEDYILSTTTYRENGLSTWPLCPQPGYACGLLPDGTRYEVPVYRVRPGEPLSAGQYTQNNAGYHQTYYGAELQLVKNFSNNWMARLGAAYADWTQHWDADGVIDPTNVQLLNGGQVVVQSLGSGDKSRVYMNSHWQLNLSSMYTFPFGLSVSGNFFARQGYPLAYFQRVIANPDTQVSYDRTKIIVVAPYDAYRLGTVTEFDLGLSQVFRISRGDLTVYADFFNVTNENTVLQRQNQIGIGGPNGTNSIREIQSPFIARFGARVSF
jgi:hypothetical protein